MITLVSFLKVQIFRIAVHISSNYVTGASDIVVCTAVFQLSVSCWILDIFVIKVKCVRNYFFCLFRTLNFVSHSVAVISWGTLRLRTKKKINVKHDCLFLLLWGAAIKK